ncbi:hypothetical protein KCU83_g432, partial [Aureobasidium melanogenum]
MLGEVGVGLQARDQVRLHQTCGRGSTVAVVTAGDWMQKAVQRIWSGTAFHSRIDRCRWARGTRVSRPSIREIEMVTSDGERVCLLNHLRHSNSMPRRSTSYSLILKLLPEAASTIDMLPWPAFQGSLHHFVVVVVVVVLFSSFSPMTAACHKAHGTCLTSGQHVKDASINSDHFAHTHLLVASTTHLRHVALVSHLLSRQLALLSVVRALGCHLAGEQTLAWSGAQLRPWPCCSCGKWSLACILKIGKKFDIREVALSVTHDAAHTRSGDDGCAELLSRTLGLDSSLHLSLSSLASSLSGSALGPGTPALATITTRSCSLLAVSSFSTSLSYVNITIATSGDNSNLALHAEELVGVKMKRAQASITDVSKFDVGLTWRRSAYVLGYACLFMQKSCAVNEVVSGPACRCGPAFHPESFHPLAFYPIRKKTSIHGAHYRSRPFHVSPAARAPDSRTAGMIRAEAYITNRRKLKEDAMMIGGNGGKSGSIHRVMKKAQVIATPIRIASTLPSSGKVLVAQLQPTYHPTIASFTVHQVSCNLTCSLDNEQTAEAFAQLEDRRRPAQQFVPTTDESAQREGEGETAGSATDIKGQWDGENNAEQKQERRQDARDVPHGRVQATRWLSVYGIRRGRRKLEGDVVVKQRIQSGGLNSFCRWMALTALCVLTGCLDSGFRPGLTARRVRSRARRPGVLEGRVEEKYSCRSWPASTRAALLSELRGTLSSFCRVLSSKLPSPPSDPVRFPQNKLAASIGKRLQCLQKIVHKTTKIMEGASNYRESGFSTSHVLKAVTIMRLTLPLRECRDISSYRGAQFLSRSSVTTARALVTDLSSSARRKEAMIMIIVIDRRSLVRPLHASKDIWSSQ